MRRRTAGGLRGSIGSKDGGYYATEAAAQESYANYDSAAGSVDSGLVPENAAEAATDETAQKIIYNASLSMESTDFDTTREALMTAVEANGAWLESTSLYGTEKDHDRTADYTVRVPVGSYRAFLAAVGDAGSVLNISESAENITSSYIDVQARLSALETQRDRLKRWLTRPRRRRIYWRSRASSPTCSTSWKTTPASCAAWTSRSVTPPWTSTCGRSPP